MREYIIVTDDCCDLTLDYIKDEHIVVAPMGFVLDGVGYGVDNPMEPKEFYRKMREDGSMPTTNALNPMEMYDAMKPVVESGKDVLCLSFSSGLSSCYQSAVTAAQELMEEFPGSTIKVVDSLAASMGEGLFVYYVNEYKKSGKTLEEAYAYAEEIKLNICHEFTVNDLMHLHRGGRVSKATAIIGTLINVKPVLHVDDEGHLISLFNVRGRKKALRAIVDNMEKNMGGLKDKNEIVFISHADSEEDAKSVQKMVEERFGIKACMMNMICPTIGSHCGPGTVALFYFGEHR